jgi:RNA recognition motif-containing protein
MGSATVVYEREEDASKAIEEYHGATLDERLLTVEYDLSALAR